MIDLGSFFRLPLIRQQVFLQLQRIGHVQRNAHLHTQHFALEAFRRKNTRIPQRTSAFGKLTEIGGRLVPSATSAAPKPRPTNSNLQ